MNTALAIFWVGFILAAIIIAGAEKIRDEADNKPKGHEQ